VKDLIGELANNLTLLESKSPGVTQEIFVNILEKLERKQSFLQSPLEFTIKLERNTEQAQMSEVATILLARWRSRIDKEREKQYFV